MKLIYILCACVFLTACTSSLLTSNAPPDDYYRLNPVGTIDKAGTSYTSIEVAKPKLPPGFETGRIALYKYDRRQLDYYAGARWPEQLDVVLQDFLVASLDAQHGIAAQAQRGAYRRSHSKGDPVLHINVLDFQPEYKGDPTLEPPEAHIALTAELIAPGKTVPYFSRHYAVYVPVAENRMSLVTAAMEQGLREVVEVLITEIQSE